jgi:hypothetical protein
MITDSQLFSALVSLIPLEQKDITQGAMVEREDAGFPDL